jgi:hypothetical protein
MIDSREVDWSGADVMITDPPYAASVYKRATSQSAKGGARHRDLGHAPLDENTMHWTCALAAKVRRWSCIFSDIESVGLWQKELRNAGATYVRAIPWIRWSMPQLSGDRPPQGCEMIVVAWGSAKGKKRWNGPGNLTHFSNRCLRGADKHKCEKPLDLVLELVEYFSHPSELVIDPFAGAGTTMLAASVLDRKFKGNEIDPEWMIRASLRSVAPLSDRDFERIKEYRAKKEIRLADMARMKSITSKARLAKGEP